MKEEKENFYTRNKFWIYMGIVVLAIVIIYILATRIYGFKPVGNSFADLPERYYHFSQFFYAFASIILALFTITFVYLAYQQQNIQNKRFKYFSHVQKFDYEFRDIINDINDIRYKNFVGIDALYNWDKEHKKNPNSVFNSINYILVRFQGHIKMIDKAEIDSETKEFLKVRAYLMFNSKIIWPIMEKIYMHPDFIKHKDKARDRLNDLITDTYKLLLDLKEVAAPIQHKELMQLLIDKGIINERKIRHTRIRNIPSNTKLAKSKIS